MRWGATGANHFFFSLGGKSLFLGADGGGGEGNRKWARMLVVPFRGQRNQRPGWCVLGCFSLNKTPEISINGTILMTWLEPLEHIVEVLNVITVLNVIKS